MPKLSTSCGIVMQMYWNEHQPPHFHALYGKHRAVIEFATLRVMRGSVPRRAHAHVVEWPRVLALLVRARQDLLIQIKGGALWMMTAGNGTKPERDALYHMGVNAIFSPK